MNRRIRRVMTLLLTFAVLAAGQSFGQTQKLIRDIGDRRTPLQNWADIGVIFVSMYTNVDMNEFKGTLALKEALIRCHEQLEKKGVAVPVLVDRYAFSVEAKEKGTILDVLSETKVKYDAAPRYLTVGAFLRLTLRQIPTANATFIIRPDFVEITTIKRANGRWIVPSIIDGIKGGRVKPKEAA